MGERSLRHTLEEQGITSTVVLEAIERVPRELFVPPDLREQAYRNSPLPIGEGQTISQPYTVAFMVELAGVGRGANCLEIGAGSGYAAAILAEAVGPTGSVVAVELIESLARRGRDNLRRAGYESVVIHCGDGREGYPAQAPYQIILVSAAADRTPYNLLDQLAPGGRLVVPVETAAGHAVMKRLEKSESGLSETDHGAFSFVPLRGR